MGFSQASQAHEVLLMHEGHSILEVFQGGPHQSPKKYVNE